MVFLNESFILRDKNICAIKGKEKDKEKDKDFAIWMDTSGQFFCSTIVSARVCSVAHTSAVTHTFVTMIIVKKGATFTTSDILSFFSMMSFLWKCQ